MNISELRQLAVEMGVMNKSMPQPSDSQFQDWLERNNVYWLLFDSVPAEKRFVNRALDQLESNGQAPTEAELQWMVDFPDLKFIPPAEESTKKPIKEPVVDSPPSTLPTESGELKNPEKVGLMNWLVQHPRTTKALIGIAILVCLGIIVPVGLGYSVKLFHKVCGITPAVSSVSPDNPERGVTGSQQLGIASDMRLELTALSNRSRNIMDNRLNPSPNAGGLLASPEQTATYLNQRLRKQGRQNQELGQRMNRVEDRIVTVGRVVARLADQVERLADQLPSVSPALPDEPLPDPIPLDDLTTDTVVYPPGYEDDTQRFPPGLDRQPPLVPRATPLNPPQIVTPTSPTLPSALRPPLRLPEVTRPTR